MFIRQSLKILIILYLYVQLLDLKYFVRYVNHPNHPRNISKELPKSINKQISDISCEKNVFINTKLTYEKALNSSGFTETF